MSMLQYRILNIKFSLDNYGIPHKYQNALMVKGSHKIWSSIWIQFLNLSIDFEPYLSYFQYFQYLKGT